MISMYLFYVIATVITIALMFHFLECFWLNKTRCITFQALTISQNEVLRPIKKRQELCVIATGAAHRNFCIPGSPCGPSSGPQRDMAPLFLRLGPLHLTHKSPLPSSGPLSTFIVRSKLLWWKQNMSASTRPTRSVPRILICLPFLPVAAPKMPKTGS